MRVSKRRQSSDFLQSTVWIILWQTMPPITVSSEHLLKVPATLNSLLPYCDTVQNQHEKLGQLSEVLKPRGFH